MRLRERVEHFGDALILLAQAGGSRDPQDAAHRLLAQLIAAHRPLNVTWVCPGEPPAACKLGVVNVPSKACIYFQGGFETSRAAASP